MEIPRGCYGVVRTSGLFPWLIRAGTLSHFDHAYIVLSDGKILEAEPSGARIANLSDYDGCERLHNTDEAMTDMQRDAVVAKALDLKGTPYGFPDIVRLSLRCLGLRWDWLTGQADQEQAMICSQLVAACGAAAGLDWSCGEKTPAEVTPADLAKRIDTYQGEK